MKKLLLALTVLLMLNSAPFVSAAIRSIVDTDNTADSSGSSYDSENYSISSEQQCINEGYAQTGCPAGYIMAGPCPYSYGYYRECCPEEYRYQESDCINHGLKPVGKCGDYYKCG